METTATLPAQKKPDLDLLNGLETRINGKIKGQPDAVKRLIRAVKRAETGFAKKGRPRASVLMLGPTGVGKTEITLAMTEALYGTTEGRIMRFDMAEYQLQDSLGLLLGTNKQEQGHLGDALDKLNALGGGVLLFDEIEKAHAQLSTVFLGLLDAARITMSNGETKDASNTYIICTSNLGSAAAIKMENVPYATLERYILKEAGRFFRPEVFARFNEKIVFRKLSYETQMEICRLFLELEIKHARKAAGVREIRHDEDVMRFLIRHGYDKFLGARPMRNTIENYLGEALANWKLTDPGYTDALRIRVNPQDSEALEAISV
jgi:ATP-dependent Clp protease ATP-binding subunit ClpB